VTIRCHFFENPTAEYLGFGRQAPALVIAESKPLVPELLPQNPILFLEVGNEIALLLPEPAGDRDQQETKLIKRLAHWARIATSVRHIVCTIGFLDTTGVPGRRKS
jgi:hypothetical protein